MEPWTNPDSVPSLCVCRHQIVSFQVHLVYLVNLVNLANLVHLVYLV